MLFRHGDILLVPSEKQGNYKTRENFVVAEGEATGHHHRLMGSVGVLEVGGDRFLKIDEPTELTHREHNTLTIVPGTYKVSVEREYDPFTENIRRVQD